MIKPVWNRLAVSVNQIVTEDEQRTQGGLYLPNGSTYMRDTHESGRVIAVGNGPEVSANLEVGDKVIFHVNAGLPIVIAGEEYRLLDYFELLAKEE